MILTHGANSLQVSSGGAVIGGRTYRTVVMPDGKLWLAENLDYKFEYNGSTLPIGGNSDYTTPHAYYFENNEASYGIDGTYKCGLLYNWYAVVYLNDNKSTLLPNGWRVPSREDYDNLITALGSNSGTKVKSIDDSVIQGFPSGWGGTDNYGFNMLPCGQRDIEGDPWGKFGIRSFPWTTTEYASDTELAYSPALKNYDTSLVMEGDYKRCGNCVRLVKDIA